MNTLVGGAAIILAFLCVGGLVLTLLNAQVPADDPDGAIASARRWVGMIIAGASFIAGIILCTIVSFFPPQPQ